MAVLIIEQKPVEIDQNQPLTGRGGRLRFGPNRRRSRRA